VKDHSGRGEAVGGNPVALVALIAAVMLAVLPSVAAQRGVDRGRAGKLTETTSSAADGHPKMGLEMPIRREGRLCRPAGADATTRRPSPLKHHEPPRTARTNFGANLSCS
jgi:hypothetical protein